MKENADLIRAWVKRAESDLAIVEMCVAAKRSLELACFHAQQAAEKYLKAYLAAADIEFPFIYNLEKLILLCCEWDPGFAEIERAGEELTPYAVQAGYDADFSPSFETVRQALETARQIKDFVLARLPRDTHR